MLVRPTSIGAALFKAASERLEQRVPKHDIANWTMARMNRPGVGVVREIDTVDKVHEYNERLARIEAQREAKKVSA